MPGVGGTGPQGEIAPARTAIEADVVVFARTGRGTVLHVEAGVAVAGDRAEAPVVERRDVRASEEPARRAVEARGIAVAVGVPPGAEALAPERQTIRCRVDRDRLAVDIARNRAVRSAGTVEGRAKALVDGVASEAAVFDQCRLRRCVDLAESWSKAFRACGADRFVMAL